MCLLQTQTLRASKVPSLSHKAAQNRPQGFERQVLFIPTEQNLRDYPQKTLFFSYVALWNLEVF